MIPYITSIILIGLGIYALLFKKNLIKIVIGIDLIECGVNLFLITLGYRKGAIAPIFTHAKKFLMVLPTPQALTLTSIVIGLAVTAFILSISIEIYRTYGTLNSDKGRLKG